MALSLHTELCDMLGIEYPIFAFNHCQDVTTAVSNGGGLGVFGLGELHDINKMHAAVNWIKNHTDEPFGLDFLLPEATYRQAPVPAAAPQTPREDSAFVSKLKKDLGLPPDYGWDEAPKPYPPTQMEVVDLICEAKPTIFAGGLGMNEEAVKKCHRAGIKVIALCGRIRHAQKVIPMGVDIIVAQGYDAGGHTGTVGTMALVPAIVDAASPLPVVAAGGIVDGRGLVAALALGAVGVWTGSIWLTAHEHPMAESLKEKLMAAAGDNTVISKCWTGKTMRHYKSLFTDYWEAAPEPKPTGGGVPGLTIISTETTDPRVEKYGLQDWMTTPCGQGIGIVNQRRPARQILHDIVSQAIDIIEN